ncbi:MAG: terpene cyclase/mutase family protein [Gemmataceae bacterium]|nr:terpene cyclase/mutase family protein [Gemmataceae bacterium]
MSHRNKLVIAGCAAFLMLSTAGLQRPSQAQENQSRGMITPATQEAIDAGLAYLAKNQNPNGSFGTNQHVGNVAITSLAGLAFMSGGHQPGRGRYGDNVTRAVRNIISLENKNVPGYLHNPRNAFHGPMYGHGFAALFLAEAHGMVNDRNLRDQLRGTLDRSIKLIINTQNHQGGWRYQPVKGDADISVTICQIMALRAARNAGITVPKKTADDCTRYVQSCQEKNSGGFRYQPFGGPPGFARTAAGLCALYSAGHYEGPDVDKGLNYLMRFKPAGRGGFFGNPEVQIHYYYGHYYAAQAMWIAGGDYWKQWYPAIREELLGSRNAQDGHWFNGQICPHYCTAMSLIILQIPNNYLPILQR